MLKNDHSLVHAGKVCLFTALICKKIGATEKTTLKAMQAAILHDIGRINNCKDAAHGERSVVKAFYYGYELPADVATAINNHSKADKKLMDLLTTILKDADALDRVRTRDLDEEYLRLPCSEELVEFASEVNKCLLKAIG